MSLPSAVQLKKALVLQEKIETLQNELSHLLGSTSTTDGAAPTRRRGMSAAGRARIAKAQRARWAKVRGEAGKGRKPRRKMSAAARARLSEIAQKRWKAVKSEGKTRL